MALTLPSSTHPHLLMDPHSTLQKWVSGQGDLKGYLLGPGLLSFGHSKVLLQFHQGEDSLPPTRGCLQQTVTPSTLGLQSR